MVKIVGDKQYGELLGAHVVCTKAADLIQELVVARDLEGGYPEVARSVHAHPTFSEADHGSGAGGRRLADPRLVSRWRTYCATV